MAYPTAAGQPTYSGVFIPEIWSSKLQVKYYSSTCLFDIANTDYEGEIKNQGDKVIIRTTPDIDIKEYRAGENLVHQRPTGNKIELLIDKGFYWDTIVDDVLEHQKDVVKMNKWSEDAAEQMKIKTDTLVFGSIGAQVSAQNAGTTAGKLSGDINLGATGSPLTVSKSTILDLIVDTGLVLDEQNVPETGRFLLLPTWAAAQLKKSDLKDASLTGDGTSVLRNGRLGMIDRFTIYSSNLLPMVTDTGKKCVTAFAGHKDGLTFANQLTKTETLRAESTFGTIMRGLNVFGFKVIKPEALAAIYMTKG